MGAMAIYVSDALTLTRNLLNDPLPSGRWTDSALTNLIDRSTKSLVASILFPSSRLTQLAVPNQQEYIMPDTHQIDRVYIAGQEIPLTSLSTLGGDQILFDDDTATGSPTSGSGGPPGAGGEMQAQWVTQTPVTYPFVNAWGAPSPMAQPWFPGQRPRAYQRGGNIGFVPAPGNAAEIVIDCVVVPSTLVNSTDQIVLPDNFLDAICWGAVERAKFSDDNDRSADQRNYARQAFEAEMKKLRTWKRRYTGNDSGPFPRTYRSDYGLGNNRWGSGTGPSQGNF